MSLRSFARLGAAIAVFGLGRYGSSMSVLDFVNLGASLSLRSFARFGSQFSVFGMTRLASTVSLLDFVQIGALKLVSPASKHALRLASFSNSSSSRSHRRTASRRTGFDL